MIVCCRCSSIWLQSLWPGLTLSSLRREMTRGRWNWEKEGRKNDRGLIPQTNKSEKARSCRLSICLSAYSSLVSSLSASITQSIFSPHLPPSVFLFISLFSSVMRAGGVSQSPNTQHVCFARHQGPTAYCSPTDWVNRQINAELSGLLVYFCRSTLHWEYMMKTACSSNRGRTRGLTGGWHRPAPWNLNCCLLALLMDCKWLHRVQAQVIKIT